MNANARGKNELEEKLKNLFQFAAKKIMKLKTKEFVIRSQVELWGDCPDCGEVSRIRNSSLSLLKASEYRHLKNSESCFQWHDEFNLKMESYCCLGNPSNQKSYSF